MWTVKNKMLCGALGSSLETNCNPGSPFETCVFLWTKLMTAGHLLHSLVFSDMGWELPSSHEGNSCHWDSTFAVVRCSFHCIVIQWLQSCREYPAAQIFVRTSHCFLGSKSTLACRNVPYVSLCAPPKIRTDSRGSHLQGAGSCQWTQTSLWWEKLSSSGYSGS